MPKRGESVGPAKGGEEEEAKEAKGQRSFQHDEAAAPCFLSVHGRASSRAAEIESTLDSGRNCHEVREKMA